MDGESLNRDFATTPPDTAVAIDVLSNDNISTGQLLLTDVTQGEHGTVVIHEQKVMYTPENDYTGIDSCRYIVNNSDTEWVYISVMEGSTLHTPAISVTGKTLLQPLETCSLIIKTFDEDIGQTLTVLLNDTPASAVLSGDTLFIWNIPQDFIGKKVLTFKVYDDGVPPLYDSMEVTISVSTEVINVPPVITIQSETTVRNVLSKHGLPPTKDRKGLLRSGPGSSLLNMKLLSHNTHSFLGKIVPGKCPGKFRGGPLKVLKVYSIH